jgi:hypothetical protein
MKTETRNNFFDSILHRSGRLIDIPKRFSIASNASGSELAANVGLDGAWADIVAARRRLLLALFDGKFQPLQSLWFGRFDAQHR